MPKYMVSQPAITPCIESRSSRLPTTTSAPMSRNACARSSSFRTIARTALPCFNSSSVTVRPTAPTRPAAPVTRIGIAIFFPLMPSVKSKADCPSSALLDECCCISFQSLRGCPERAWIHAVWMQCQHLLVKVDRSRCLRHDLVEVAEVGAGFLDVTRRAVGIKHTMTGYYCSRMQGLDLIERAEPLTSGLFIAFCEIRVGIVVDRIPRYNQATRRHMQRRGVLRVGMAKFYYLELFSLKI